MTSNFPTVSARAVPPCTGTAYRCSQPLFSQGNTRSSWLVQNRFVAEGVSLFTEIVGRNTLDRKSTRLNSSHTVISYAVFCLKKKKKKTKTKLNTHRK